MPWHARLSLNYHRQDQRTVLLHSHDGPLRIFKSLYPEGPTVCHNVIVHPPGGVVGGDRLDIGVEVASGAHALISTPGATRFYASDTDEGAQHVNVVVHDGARLEWLPLETLVYPGSLARNHLHMTLEGNAQMIGWDLVGLGLPQAGQAFTHGRLHQCIEWPGRWLEQARIDGADERLMDSPVGLAGRRCLGTLWLASGQAMGEAQLQQLLASVREVLEASGISGSEVDVAATSPNPHLLVVRGLSPLVEPLMTVFQKAWATLRQQAWGISGQPPRIWSV